MTSGLEARLASALGAPATAVRSDDWVDLADRALGHVTKRARRARRASLMALLIFLACGAGLVSLASPETTTVETRTMVLESTSSLGDQVGRSDQSAPSAQPDQSAPSAQPDPIAPTEGDSGGIDIRVETRQVEVGVPWAVTDAAPKAIAVLAVVALTVGGISWIRRRRVSRPFGMVARVVFALLVAVVAAVTIFTWTFKVFYIPSDSMAPTIESGDRVLAVRADGAGEPGDIVIFDRPVDHPGATGDLMKRIVASEGDTFEIVDGQVLVNGEVSLFVLEPASGSQGEFFQPIVVPSGHVFVLGDNLSGSLDSRHFGPVPVDSIGGVVRWANGGLPSIAEPVS